MDTIHIATRDEARSAIERYNGKLPQVILIGERTDGFFFKDERLISIESIRADKSKNLYRLFYGCRSLVKVPDVMEFPSAVSMDSIFGECITLNQEFEIKAPRLKSVRGAFMNCSKLKKSPKITTDSTPESGIRDASELFAGCLYLKDVSGIDFSKVTNFNKTFSRCIRLKDLDIDTSSGRTFNGTFSECESLIKSPRLDTSNAVQMEYMFKDCKKLKEVIELDTSNCTSIWGMFSYCSSLKSIPKLNFSKLGSVLYSYNNLLKYVFGGCPNSEELAKTALGDQYKEFSRRDNSMTNFSGRMYNLYSRLVNFGG